MGNLGEQPIIVNEQSWKGVPFYHLLHFVAYKLQLLSPTVIVQDADRIWTTIAQGEHDADEASFVFPAL
jgi:hypothetical protein